MDRKSRHRKCLCCNELFTADPRNGRHQVFCSKGDCRRASKAVSQRRWLARAANRNYFRSPENVLRVQEWRQAHPGYEKRRPKPPEPSQAPGAPWVGAASDLVTQPGQTSLPLQDVCLAGHPAFIGLIAMVTGRTLQEDIAATARRVEAHGRDILGRVPPGRTPIVLTTNKTFKQWPTILPSRSSCRAVTLVNADADFLSGILSGIALRKSDDGSSERRRMVQIPFVGPPWRPSCPASCPA